MKIILDYIFGTLYLLFFGLVLAVFHPIQWFFYTFFGQKAHQKVVEAMNFCVVHGWILSGSTSSFSQKEVLPTDKTIIFIANHQSMFDIPGIIWYLKKHTPLFISKKELAQGIPSISYNLRVGKAALIDRNDSRQAISEIVRFANYIYKNNYSAVIFPEGTRSRTGKLKPFSVGGVATLLKKCPNAEVVPIAILNTGRFNPSGMFPLKSFTSMSWNTLNRISTIGKTPEQIVEDAQNQINDFLNTNAK